MRYREIIIINGRSAGSQTQILDSLGILFTRKTKLLLISSHSNPPCVGISLRKNLTLVFQISNALVNSAANVGSTTSVPQFLKKNGPRNSSNVSPKPFLSMVANGAKFPNCFPEDLITPSRTIFIQTSESHYAS